MYEPYWHLDRPAFDNDADTRFYFPGRSHQGALLKLRYAIENRKGAALLVGGHGLGKTYLTHVLEHDLEATYRPVIRLLFPQLSPAEFLAYLASRLGATDTDTAPLRVDRALRQLERRLEELTLQHHHPVLIVDEAHLLEAAHLQTLQLLLNFEQEPRIAFSLLLVGQPELLPKIARVSALHERISVRTTLQPLSETETLAYVKHRLQVAGVTEPIFADETLQSFWELSHGIPRKINQLCDLSLLVGFADGLQSLTPIELEAAAGELVGVSCD